MPPPRANYGATALQCVIFDFYQEDYAKKMKEKEEEKPKRVIRMPFICHLVRSCKVLTWIRVIGFSVYETYVLLFYII